MKVNHIIWIPFCSSRHRDWKIGIRKLDEGDAVELSDTYIENRMRYLESVCFPSIVGQHNQAFTWILAIDPELPVKFVRRLEALIASRPGSILHRVKDARWEQSEWISPYLSESPTHLVTTNLDSDDGLDRRFTEYIKEFVGSKATVGSSPPVMILGFHDTMQWDLSRTLLAPFGWKANWHRWKN